MMHRGVRIGLLLLFVAAIGLAGYQAFALERQIAGGHEAARSFDELAWSVAVSIADLRAGQQAYVAAGQGDAYWAGKVLSRLDVVKTRLASLRQVTTAGAAASALDSAASAIQNFAQMDARARDYAATGQRLMASDLIFTDGLELTQTAAAHVEAARSQERAAREAAARGQRLIQAYGLAGAGAIGLLLMALLVPVRRATAAAAEAARREDAPAQPGARLDLSPLPALDDVRSADLRKAAELCTDLSRITGARDFPPLLERAAALLNASGIVVWMTDPAGRELRPALAHGYPPQTLARLGGIGRDADNATAAAFRTGRLQIVAGGGVTNGAVIAPLMAPAGCVGVMAAEVRKGGEASEAVRAIATILAAQVAALVAPAPGGAGGSGEASEAARASKTSGAGA